MGREWRRSGGHSPVERNRGRGSGGKDSPSGCMSAVLQLFDFYPFHFSVHHHQQSFKDESALLKGAEATRNSSVSVALESGPLSSMGEEAVDEDPNTISVGIQTETRRDTRKDTRLKVMVPESRTTELASQSSSSPEPKTPNLMVRLMGLDSIPETPSPSLPGSTIPLRKFRKGRADSGTRSLPETPRMSASRRSSDADPRLSLQLDEESIGEEEVLRRKETIKRTAGDESRRSAGGLARQRILRQVKESVMSRRGFGTDITNTTRPRDNRGDELSILTKSKGTIKLCSEFQVEEQSPRVKTSEPRCKTVTTFTAARDRTSNHENPTQPSATNATHHTRCVVNHPLLPIKSSSKHKPHPQKKPIRDREKARERFSSGRKRQEEAFVTTWTKGDIKSDRKCKPNRSPPSPKKNQEEPFVTPWTKCNIKSDRKRKPNRSPPPPKTAAQELPRRSSANSTSQPHKQDADRRDHKDRSKPSAAVTGGGGAEFHDIATILKCTGIDRDSQVPISDYYSSAFHHHLDPSNFHHLKHSFASSSVRCNRRLAVEQVEETEVVLGVEEHILESLVRESIAELGDGAEGGSDRVRQIGEVNLVQPSRGTLDVIRAG